MKVADIPPDIRQRIAQRRFDRIIEKHEGPWPWEYWIADNRVEFLRVNTFEVLLPVEKEYHKNITILRCIVGDGGQVLTIFLKDITHESGIFAGRVAICEKEVGEQWYVATLYHEWFILDESQ
jgi:hypothetical protein